MQLLIATRLSAQCTDVRVNQVSGELFDTFKTADDFANADVTDIERIIKPCGLYKTKARDIKNMCAMLTEKLGGNIPDSIDGLTALPGVGRKTANLVVGEVFSKPAVVADTHCIRLSNRLGLCDTKDPAKVEKALRALLPSEESLGFCHRLVYHGRRVCTARSPACSGCILRPICPYGKEAASVRK